jgi:hypothetical protein
MLKLRPLLNWLALFGVVGFFFPYFQHTTLNGVSERKFTLGVPFSPWIIASWKEAEDRTEKNKDGTTRSVHSGDFSSSVNVEVFSWSSLLGVVGFGLLEVNRRLRPKTILQGS